MSSNKRVIIQTNNLMKAYSPDTGLVINDLSIDLFENDFTVIMGSSGSGKSTLLYCLSGLDNINSGSIKFQGSEICDFDEKDKAKFRNSEIGFVFQQNNLLSNFTCIENILIAANIGSKKLYKNKYEAMQKATQLFDELMISDTSNKLPTQTSGGQQQRVAIVRALINKPKIIFADEPTGALNSKTSAQILDVFNNINNSGQSILMVTHDVKSAIRGNRIIYLKDGSIVGDLSTEPYNGISEKHNKEREKKISQWLASFGW